RPTAGHSLAARGFDQPETSGCRAPKELGGRPTTTRHANAPGAAPISAADGATGLGRSYPGARREAGALSRATRREGFPSKPLIVRWSIGPAWAAVAA